MLLDLSTHSADLLPAAEFFRLTLDQYHRMAQLGILHDGDGIELLDGLLYRKSCPAAPTPVGMVEVGAIVPLTPAQFRLMRRAGILTDDDAVELIEGVIYNRMTILPPHTGTVIRLNSVLKPLVPVGWRYRQEQPINLFDGEPMPDGAIATGSDDDNFRFHPLARDVVVVIEVAESSLLRDRTVKLRSYAHAGIPFHWIINLVDRQIEVHTDPDATAESGPTYRRREVYAGDAAVSIPVANVTIPVAALLPPVG